MNSILKMLKKFLRKYSLVIFIYFFIFIVLTFPLPYYIDCTGGIINAVDKVELNNKIELTGSLNMSYVTELRATIPTLIYSKINKNWDLHKKEEIIPNNETIDDVNFRNKMLLKEANNNAIYYAYKLSSKKVEIINNKVYITYIDINSNTDLKIGDQILEIDGNEISSKSDILEIIDKKTVGDILRIKVLRNGKEKRVNAKLYNNDGKKVIGVIITEEKELLTDPKINIVFDSSETGPSGGMMLTLAIYSLLNDTDLTNGNIIVGTGTIDEMGNIGSIGGVKYKLAGSVKEKADIFLVPNGENYEEAIKLKEENDYSIDIVGVSTIEDVIKYLSNHN